MKKILIVMLGLLINNEGKAMIYHLTEATGYDLRIKNEHLYEPSLESEGFIHNATLTQVLPVANRHYQVEQEILLLAIDEKLVDSPLRYDYVAKYKENFPHIYGPLNITAIVQIYVMSKNTDGSYELPKELQQCSR